MVDSTGGRVLSFTSERIAWHWTSRKFTEMASPSTFLSLISYFLAFVFLTKVCGIPSISCITEVSKQTGINRVKHHDDCGIVKVLQKQLIKHLWILTYPERLQWKFITSIAYYSNIMTLPLSGADIGLCHFWMLSELHCYGNSLQWITPPVSMFLCCSFHFESGLDYEPFLWGGVDRGRWGHWGIRIYDKQSLENPLCPIMCGNFSMTMRKSKEHENMWKNVLILPISPPL